MALWGTMPYVSDAKVKVSADDVKPSSTSFVTKSQADEHSAAVQTNSTELRTAPVTIRILRN
jgi:hypothetical protein